MTPSSFVLAFSKVFLLNVKWRSEYAAAVFRVFFVFTVQRSLVSLDSLQCLIFPLVASCSVYRLTIQCAVCNIHEISPDVACITFEKLDGYDVWISTMFLWNEKQDTVLCLSFYHFSFFLTVFCLLSTLPRILCTTGKFRTFLQIAEDTHSYNEPAKKIWKCDLERVQIN